MISEKLQAEKNRLELENTLLRAQINPHFLYNVLNFLYAKALPLSDTLSNAVLRLSDIMRYSLKPRGADGLVPVDDEIKHIENVLSLAQLRFQNKLSIELTNIGQFGEAKIPPLTFVTLVENLLKHGNLHEPQSPASIFIEMQPDGILRFVTQNKKRTGPVESSNSIGLDNTVRRLKDAFGDKCSIVITDEPDTFRIDVGINFAAHAPHTPNE